jgi:histidyl-tRNA synthetase
VLDSTNPEIISLAILRQAELIEQGYQVRLEERPKKLNILLENLAEQGFNHFAIINVNSQSLETLEIKPIA